MGTPFAVLTAPEPRRPRAKREEVPVKNVAEKVTQAKPDQSVPPAWDAMKDSVRAAVASQLSHPGALATSPESLRQAVDAAVIEGLRLALETTAERWIAETVGADRYERASGRQGLRSGYRSHTIAFGLGPVEVRIPKPRSGPSRPEWLSVLKAVPDKLVELSRKLWFRGMSYRDLAAHSEELLGVGRSHATIGRWVQDVTDEMLRWLNRPVSAAIRYLVLDAIYLPVVRQTSAKEPVLVALGITADGHKEILDVLHAPSESAEAWSTLLTRLKMRGLKPEQLSLVLTDGDAGLISALAATLQSVPRQRCTVHKIRNVVGACPRGLKATAPAQAAAIYKAISRDEAKRRATAFIAEYEPTCPRLARIVEDDLDACLRFYDFDATLWQALRSTNALERINRELRRKLREVGAIKGEHDVTRLAVGVARFVNDEMKGVPIDGFRPAAKRKNRR